MGVWRRLRTADRRSITKRRPVGGLSWRTNPPSLVANHVGIIGRRGTSRLQKIVSLTVIQTVRPPSLADRPATMAMTM